MWRFTGIFPLVWRSVSKQIALKVLPALEGEAYNPKSGIVSIVQNDACGVDAVQTLLSSTFGKGNLMVRDHASTFSVSYAARMGVEFALP